MNKTVCVLVLCVWFSSAGAAFSQVLNASSKISSQELLQASTKAWLSIPDAQRLDEKFMETQLGQLSQDEKLAPFMQGVKAKFKQWLQEKNVRLGVNVSDLQDVRSGEICIAGILPNQIPNADKAKLGRGSHGLVLLVDVSENTDQATELLKKIGEDLISRGVSKEPYDDVNGAEVTKWKFPKKSRLKNHRFAYQTITNGWLLSSDNESIFREIVRRLVNIGNVQKGDTLAAQPAFKRVMEKVAVEDRDKPQILWYINPFGYIQLAQAIEREEQEIRQINSNDWAGILQQVGFDGFKAVGGTVRFATSDHEVLHRTFVYKPVDPDNQKQKQVFEMFDFTNRQNTDLHPPAFVPESVSSYISGTWNMQSALKNVGAVVDAMTNTKGSFEDTLSNLKVEMGVDVTKVVSQLANRLTMVTKSELPIGDKSERIAICVSVDGDPKYLGDMIEISWPQQHLTSEFEGQRIIEITDAVPVEDPPFGVDEDDEPDWAVGDEEIEEEDPVEPTFNVFQRKICSVTDDFLFVCNNEDLLKSALTGEPQKTLGQSSDYLRVTKSLQEMADAEKISIRQFVRMDRVIRPNYESLRTGNMAASKTVLARLINHLFESKKKNENAVRAQQIDGSTLPSDFESEIAPYFGPAGWVMEVDQDGWLFSGVVLEREEPASQIVKKEESTQRK